MLGKIGGRRKRGRQRMRWLDGITDLMEYECEQTPGDSEEQGSLACCSPWGRKESDTTERLSNHSKRTVSGVTDLGETGGNRCSSLSLEGLLVLPRARSSRGAELYPFSLSRTLDTCHLSRQGSPPCPGHGEVDTVLPSLHASPSWPRSPKRHCPPPAFPGLPAPPAVPTLEPAC